LRWAFLTPHRTSTSWTPSSDLAVDRYRVWVRGFAADGSRGTWSTEIVVPAPSLISPLHATFDHTPAFTWTSVFGSLSCVVRVRNTDYETVIINETVMAPATSFTPLAELPSNLYLSWDVRAVGPVGYQSVFSPANRLFIGGRPVIFGPSGAAGSRTPIFSWSAVQDASRYELRVDRTDVVQNRLIERTNLTTNSFTAPTALSAGTYCFWVRAVSVTGEFSPRSLISNFTLAAVEVDEPLPSANLEDAPILTALPVIRGLATGRSLESQDASRSIVSKADQDSASDDSDKPQTHHSLLRAQGIAIVSDELQLSVSAMSMVEIHGSAWAAFEPQQSLIDEVMSSSHHVWWQ
jgi:hypothetical protein